MTQLCACGCGQPTPIATRTARDRGWVKGEPIRYIRFHHLRDVEHRSGPYKADRFTVEDRGYDTPCHVWQLGRSGKGYGSEWDSNRGRTVQAHILAWERERGPVPDGMELDHLCRVRACVNVEHLEPVTHVDNVRRSSRSDRRREVEDRVVALLEAGRTQDEIAVAVGISQTMVSRIRRARGVPTSQELRRSAVRLLLDAGWAQSDVAVAVGVDQATVSRIKRAA